VDIVLASSDSAVFNQKEKHFEMGFEH